MTRGRVTSQRHVTANRTRRPLRTALSLVVAGGLGVAAWSAYTIVRDTAESDEVVLYVEPATASVPPTTLPPETEIREAVAPVAIQIDQLSLDNDIRAVGIEDDGGLEVPDETEVGWYEYGSSPGLPGSTVLAAHVSWNGTLGPFHQLGSLVPGDEVDVVLTDGSIRQYEVVERTMYAKDALPSERIWTTDGDETLVLITCGGSFNPEIRRYRHNIVVYAVPVDQSDSDGSDGIDDGDGEFEAQSSVGSSSGST